MTVSIIYDPEANVAALVDVDAPAALGPIATGDPGEDPRLPLQEFMAGLDKPADSMPTWVLFNEWTAYVQAIVRLVEDEYERSQEPPGGPDASGEGETSGEVDGAAPGPGGEAVDPTEAGSTDGSGPPSEGQSSSTSPSLSFPPGPQPDPQPPDLCWMCNGDKQITGPSGPMDCPVCHGEGVVPATA